MPYSIRYQREAKAELVLAQETYGAAFRDETTTWLQEVAAAAERRNYPPTLNSADLAETLEAVLGAPSEAWPSAWRRWVKAGIREKLQALLILVRKRCPPWETRVAERTFSVVDAFTAEVMAFFDVDHVHKTVTFRLFHGLPGQG
jgi:hypothetical protein